MWPFSSDTSPAPTDDTKAATTPDVEVATLSAADPAPQPVAEPTPRSVSAPPTAPTQPAREPKTAIADPVLPGAMPPPKSTSIVTQSIPPLDSRWLHAGMKTVNLPSAPVALETVFSPFSYAENVQIEAVWDVLPPLSREEVVDIWGAGDGEWGKQYKEVRDKKATAVVTKIQEEMAKDNGGSPPKVEAQDEATMYKNHVAHKCLQEGFLDTLPGLPIGQDAMFEVDFQTLSLFSVFWRNLPRIPVVRGTWFMVDETRPVTWQLAKEIEDAYRMIKPWEQEYQDSLAEAIASKTESRLQHDLSHLFGIKVFVIFEDAIKCRLISHGPFISRIFGGKPTVTPLYRGYSAAVVSKAKPASEEKKGDNVSKSTNDVTSDGKRKRSVEITEQPTSDLSSSDEVGTGAVATDPVQAIIDRVKADSETQQCALDQQSGTVCALNEDKPCTDLILAIHGMGQNLALQYESLNFVYSTNQLRHVLQKQSAEPALASMVGDRRCQIIPVQWRLNLDDSDPDQDPETYYTVDDITIKNSIPYIRQLTKAVLMDLPLFMSHHRQKMIDGVVAETNKMYRLWLARNPDFEKIGKVHIVGHSLGSALAAHILSNQPTTVPPFDTLTKMEVENYSKQSFLFNTENFFMCGSPMGLFMQLEQARLIPRTGRGKVPAPPEDSHPDPGKFGCMAVDSIYNVFYSTDPIANAVNAAVEVATARNRPPLPIPGRPYSGPIPLLSALSTLPPLPALPTFPQSLPPLRDWHTLLPGYGKKAPEAKAAPPMPQMILGEKRFAELNPHGTIDFVLPSTALNNYLESVTAHLNYWTDPTFAAFITVEMFASECGKAKSVLKELAEVKPAGK